MNGELVGEWSLGSTGTPTFRYDPAWPESPRARPLSLSLPILPGNAPHQGAAVAAWFDNLLPDSRAIRERLAQRFRTRSTRVFDLLAAIGRDCVGAVQLLPAGSPPPDVRQIDADPIDENAVAQVLRDVTAPRRPGASMTDGADFRISIAGAQEKTALLRLDGAWHRPRGATPTTHILKLPLGLVGGMQFDLHDSVENEWLCMQLLAELGFSVAHTEIATFADDRGVMKALVVARFDRTHDPAGWIVRLPQEDFCQALAVAPDAKYEADGGPGVPQAMTLLGNARDAAADRLAFARAQLAFWLLAATDGHAKNFSLFLRRDGHVLTPLYDVLSAWPVIGRGPGELAYEHARLAMAVRTRGGERAYRDMGRIPLRAWRRLAAATGVPDAFAHFEALVHAVEPALARVEPRVPAGFPEHVWSRIRDGMLRHRDLFLASLATNAGGEDDLRSHGAAL
ncbi:MAG: type II toxin-antitoxin system HipA family toxin [Gemmatimonadaceae bacterium]|jgi:serine/threonine-protein kinase HipA|nr:type II toxin-antitoxin system HipA family toxin [Gemmatimonadaceae bacterium]